MLVHVVRVGLFCVDGNGVKIDKNAVGTRVSDVLGGSQEFLVIPDSQVASSVGFPSIKRFLELEAAAGFSLRHLDQSFVVTYSS